MFFFLDNIIKGRNEWLSKPYYHYPNPNFQPILNTNTKEKEKTKLNTNTNQQS